MGMSLAVVSYPAISPEDGLWLDALRYRFPDLAYPRLPPHVTLVFPTMTVDAATLIHYMHEVVQNFEPINFMIRCALYMPDALGNNTHVFLVPDEGFSAIVRLHDQLYRGLLAPALRLDIPFIPHITVGYSADAAYCKSAVDAINAENREISGTLSVLQVLAVSEDGIQSIERLRLNVKHKK